MGLLTPVVGIDRLDRWDRVRVRTALRAADYTAYEIEKFIMVQSGEIARIATIVARVARGAARVRCLWIDGDEMKEAHEEPGQFKVQHDETGELVFRPEQTTK
jgi:hypothetical protein